MILQDPFGHSAAKALQFLVQFGDYHKSVALVSWFFVLQDQASLYSNWLLQCYYYCHTFTVASTCFLLVLIMLLLLSWSAGVFFLLLLVVLWSAAICSLLPLAAANNYLVKSLKGAAVGVCLEFGYSEERCSICRAQFFCFASRIVKTEEWWCRLWCCWYAAMCDGAVWGPVYL